MTDDDYEHAKQKHEQHMAERDKLTDAARESSRSFDQAVLAFGAAVFGASVAFLKDVAASKASLDQPVGDTPQTGTAGPTISCGDRHMRFSNRNLDGFV